MALSSTVALTPPAAAASTCQAASAERLAACFSAAAQSSERETTIVLTQTSTQPFYRSYEVPAGKHVRLDLNGHRLWLGKYESSLEPRLLVPGGTALTILDSSTAQTGALRAAGGLSTPAIGSRERGGGLGDITIDGGKIDVSGGAEAPAIGSTGFQRTDLGPGHITINGGTVNAVGGKSAPGIGFGPHAKATSRTITINGGTVVAQGGHLAAGIGTGELADAGPVVINGGKVEAYAGDNAGRSQNIGGAGIGAGDYGAAGPITINGGEVLARGTGGGADLGPGFRGVFEAVFVGKGARVTLDGHTPFGYLAEPIFSDWRPPVSRLLLENHGTITMTGEFLCPLFARMVNTGLIVLGRRQMTHDCHATGGGEIRNHPSGVTLRLHPGEGAWSTPPPEKLFYYRLTRLGDAEVSLPRPTNAGQWVDSEGNVFTEETDLADWRDSSPRTVDLHFRANACTVRTWTALRDCAAEADPASTVPTLVQLLDNVTAPDEASLVVPDGVDLDVDLFGSTLDLTSPKRPQTPGATVPDGATLTVRDTLGRGAGTLRAHGGSLAAGIGGVWGEDSGDVTVVSGNVEARGGTPAAAIGGSEGGRGVDLTVGKDAHLTLSGKTAFGAGQGASRSGSLVNAGHVTLTSESATGMSAVDTFTNAGTLTVDGLLINRGTLTNSGVLAGDGQVQNNGAITDGGTVKSSLEVTGHAYELTLDGSAADWGSQPAPTAKHVFAPTLAQAQAELPVPAGTLASWRTEPEAGSPALPVTVSQETALSSLVAPGSTALRLVLVPGPQAPTPKVSGSPQVGERLTATLPEAVTALLEDARVSHQWYADGKPLPGADAASLAVQADHLGQRLSIQLTVAGSDGLDGTWNSEPTEAVAPGVQPAFEARLEGTADGTALVGSTVTVSVDPEPAGTLSYSWLANGRSVATTTTNALFLPPELELTRLTVLVSSTLEGHHTARVYAPTVTVLSERPRIEGVAQVGASVTAAGLPTIDTGELFLAWLADGEAIQGAHDRTLTITEELLGKTLQLQVTRATADGVDVSTTSAATAPVTRPKGTVTPPSPPGTTPSPSPGNGTGSGTGKDQVEVPSPSRPRIRAEKTRVASGSTMVLRVAGLRPGELFHVRAGSRAAQGRSSSTGTAKVRLKAPVTRSGRVVRVHLTGGAADRTAATTVTVKPRKLSTSLSRRTTPSRGAQKLTVRHLAPRERVRVRQGGRVVKVRANRAGVAHVKLRAPARAGKVVVKVRATTTGRTARGSYRVR